MPIVILLCLLQFMERYKQFRTEVIEDIYNSSKEKSMKPPFTTI